MVETAEKYNRGQIAPFNLFGSFKSDDWELKWGYVKHDPTRGHICDLIWKIPSYTNFNQRSKISTNNYIRGPQFLMQYLEILQQGKTFHSLLGTHKYKVASKLSALSIFNFSSSAQIFTICGVVLQSKVGLCKIIDNEIFSNYNVFDTFLSHKKKQIPKCRRPNRSPKF